MGFFSCGICGICGTAPKGRETLTELSNVTTGSTRILRPGSNILLVHFFLVVFLNSYCYLLDFLDIFIVFILFIYKIVFILLLYLFVDPHLNSGAVDRRRCPGAAEIH